LGFGLGKPSKRELSTVKAVPLNRVRLKWPPKPLPLPRSSGAGESLAARNKLALGGQSGRRFSAARWLAGNTWPLGAVERRERQAAGATGEGGGAVQT